jgi:hypothetical protein
MSIIGSHARWEFPSPVESSDTPRLRCRFDLPLPETLESRADDAIMAGPIVL